MRLRVHRKRPESWALLKERLGRAWLRPLWAIEWFWEWVAYVLSNWSFIEVLEYLGSFGVLIAVIFYFAESGDRVKQKHYQAWQVINTAQGKGGSGGRLEALQELNGDGVSLVGVDVSGAFLQGVRLQHARLVRANFNAADLRDSDFAGADLSDANLQSANFRHTRLHNANLERADCSDTDLWNSDLSGSNLSGAIFDGADMSFTIFIDPKWREIRSIKKANIYGMVNPPDGFVDWAKKHGAVEVAPKETTP
jgi:hypothetical protein